MWDFEHPPHAAELATRYDLHYTAPAICAAELLSGRADLGLVPVASLTPDLAIIPGCTIASRDQVRSILLLIKQPFTLETIRSLAVDTASRSSIAYAQVLLRTFHANDPELLASPADPVAMLAQADAALIIGDPALLAREHRADLEAAAGPLLWIDLAREWHTRTGLPWVAAVWAVRPKSLTPESTHQLILDLNTSRDHGLAHVEDLVQDWAARIALPVPVIREYLTHNIHYHLDEPCLQAIRLFRSYAAGLGILSPLEHLHLLEPAAQASASR